MLQLITVCKGRLDHLRMSLPTWLAEPGCEIIVVDFDCPDGCGAWARAQGPRVKVVEVTDRKVFNLCEGRNLGLAQATSDWIGFIDADIKARPGLLEQVKTAMAPRRYLRIGGEQGDTMGTVFLPRDLALEVGGYDEVIAGWGAEDRDFYERLERKGFQPTFLPMELVEAIPHGDDRRVILHGSKAIGWVINRLYLEAKTALVGQLRRELSQEERRELYANVMGVIQGTQPGTFPSLTTGVPWRPWILGLDLAVDIVFRLRPHEARG